MKITPTKVRSQYRKICRDQEKEINKIAKKYHQKLKNLQKQCTHPPKARTKIIYSSIIGPVYYCDDCMFDKFDKTKTTHTINTQRKTLT